ncbi:MAG: hypothetical protein Q8858_11395 [Bacteroidota bacterium]|nr:hypothetical protein [Bacteroidota bacterium]
MLNLKKILVLFLIFFLFNPGLKYPQKFLLRDLPQNTVSASLRYIHPIFDHDVESDIISGIYDINVSFPISRRMNLNVILPIEHINLNEHYNTDPIEGYYYGYWGMRKMNETNIGNLYLGLQSKSLTEEDSKTNTAFGIFIPTTSKDKAMALSMSYFTDIYNPSKYIPETFSLYFNLSNEWKFQNGMNLRLEGGPDVLIPSGSKEYQRETQMYIHYGISLGYSYSQFFANSELLGLTTLRGSNMSFTDRFINGVSLGAGWQNEVFSAGMFYQWHLNHWIGTLTDGSVGIKFGFVVPE